MTLYYRPGDEKAQSHPFALGRNKRLEKPVGDGRVNSRAAIGHAYGDPSGFLRSRLDCHAALVRLGIGDRVEGVDEQIQQALLELDTIAGDSLHRRRDSNLHWRSCGPRPHRQTSFTTSSINAPTPIAVLCSSCLLNMNRIRRTISAVRLVSSIAL